MVWCFVWNQCSKHKPRGSFVNTPALHSSLFFAIRVSYYLKSTPRTQVQLEISDISGYLNRTVILPSETGINRYIWNMQFDPTPLQQGVFSLRNKIAKVSSNEERQRVISSARSRLSNLVGTQREREFLEQTLQQFASGGRRFRRGRGGQAQGFDAEPGEYIGESPGRC